MKSLIILFIVFSIVYGASIDIKKCEKEKRLMYIYDEELNDCFAIRVNPCEEKPAPGIYSMALCNRNISRHPKCSMRSDPITHSDGSFKCNSNDLHGRKCPRGSVCKGTVCCDEKIETEYILEKYTTSCAPGVKASREDGRILYSKDCSINFCPSGATCTMGINFAFCCPPF